MHDKTRFAFGSAALVASFLTIATLGTTGAAGSYRILAHSEALTSRAATPPCGPGLDIKNTAKDSRCFELRTYTIAEGSSADVLHARFRERTIELFQKHGMTVIGFWQPVARLDQLVYILAFRDAAARDSAWAAFNADPDWVKTRSEMQVHVDVENTFMVATDYSPLK
ncbi:MAG TPA: NIPSNAP family protein [Gemmatimonadaceae bacterium]|nr:NIPSNAP family protein [Gemmatimonadaceae bacterium]